MVYTPIKRDIVRVDLKKKQTQLHVVYKKNTLNIKIRMGKKYRNGKKLDYYIILIFINSELSNYINLRQTKDEYVHYIMIK